MRVRFGMAAGLATGLTFWAAGAGGGDVMMRPDDDLLSGKMRVKKALALGRAWAGHPVGFAFETRGDDQYVGWYNENREMIFAQRKLGDDKWTLQSLGTRLEWDSHNSIALAFDRRGVLHVAGNMQCRPLLYWRSERPGDIASLTPVGNMVGRDEGQCTYPIFFAGVGGRLHFLYRDGTSGDGSWLVNAYDEERRAWTRLLSEPLFSARLGDLSVCAYPIGMGAGPDGVFHLFWVWRNSPDCASNHDLSYARSDDLIHWTDSAGRALALPITVESGEAIDPAPPGGGLLNGNERLGFDAQGRPVVTYHKYDAAGDLQVYAARRETDGWKIRQLSDWKGYRWDFHGGGSIVAEVHVGEVRAAGAGRLALDYRYGRGAGTWVLDEATLRPIPGAVAPASPARPAAARKLESKFPGMRQQTRADVGDAGPGVRYSLEWETLEANRDRPRDPPWPEPSMLRVIGES